MNMRTYFGDTTLVRRETAYARTPYRPAQASTSDKIPNAVDSAETLRSVMSECATCFSIVETLVISSVEFAFLISFVIWAAVAVAPGE